MIEAITAVRHVNTILGPNTNLDGWPIYTQRAPDEADKGILVFVASAGIQSGLTDGEITHADPLLLVQAFSKNLAEVSTIANEIHASLENTTGTYGAERVVSCTRSAPQFGSNTLSSKEERFFSGGTYRLVVTST